MKRPKYLKIAGHKIPVEYKKELLFDAEQCLGLYKHMEQKMYIDQTLRGSKFVEILLHESLHCIDDTYDLKLGEERVNFLALEILRFINDNNLDLRTDK